MELKFFIMQECYGDISPIPISWFSLSRFLFLSVVSLGWFFTWPIALETSSIIANARGRDRGLFHRDGSERPSSEVVPDIK
jgi:hypothetical protein